MPASWNGPRRASGLLGAERCDPQPSQALRCHVADTPRRVDEVLRTSCSPVSILNCSLSLQQADSLPDASSCVSHSTFVPALPVLHSRDACRVPLVSSARPSPASLHTILSFPLLFYYATNTLRSGTPHFSPICKLRYKPDGFAKQNGRGAERADTLTL